MFKFINFKSGSKGNCSFFIDDSNFFIIDVGFNKKEFNSFLKEVDKSCDDIDAIFLTHSHIDHIKGLKYIDLNKIHFLKDEDIKVNENNLLYLYLTYNIGDFSITPIKTIHDVNSCGYIIEYKKIRFGYITDTGYIPLKSLMYLKNLDYYYFEANHDILALLNSNRTETLKERILSSYGHLSNDYSFNYLADLIGPKTKEVILAHISEECNHSLFITEELKKTIKKSDNLYLSIVRFELAAQNEPTELIIDG